MKRETIRCSVRFVTPAFLGGADQAAQWRTPPFKALLRQWWRVVWVGKSGTSGQSDANELRRAEAELFGSAADDRAGTSRASQVTLRLDWRKGTEVTPTNWRAKTDKVHHPEAEKAKYYVDAALYLGYGPLDFDKQNGQRLNRPSALPAGDERELTVKMPPNELGPIKTALRLAHAFGGLGSRSRNGWGSLHFEQGGLSPEELEGFLEPKNRKAREWLRPFSRPWRNALYVDWCHAIGQDDEKRLLIWRTEAMDRWEEVMKRLAEVKIAFRTKLSAVNPRPFSERHVLAYPVTSHGLPGRKDKRLANQILFKVLPQGGRYVGVIVHLPHGVPADLWSIRNRQEEKQLRALQQNAWSTVHRVLDSRHDLQRLA